MKKLLIFLLLLSQVAFAQLPCTLPAATSIPSAGKFMFCDGTVSKEAPFSLLQTSTLDPAKVPVFSTRSIGLVKWDGTNWVFDNTSYLSTSIAASTYLPLSGGMMTGDIGSSALSFTVGKPFSYTTYGLGVAKMYNLYSGTETYVESNYNGNVTLSSRDVPDATSNRIFQVRKGSDFIFYGANAVVDARRTALLTPSSFVHKSYVDSAVIAGSSGVSSITGTTNRISVTGTTTPSIDISASYAGQSSIQTVGNVNSGAWLATPIGTSYGGLGLTSLGSALQNLRVNAGGTALEYYTPSGGGGSGTVNSGSANRLAYYAGSGTAVSNLPAITANKALVSDANGLPVASTTSTTELGYVTGVTSDIQTQLNGKLNSISANSGNMFYATDVSNTTTSAPTLRTFNNFDLPVLSRQKVKFSGNVLGFGDSFMAGQQAVSPSRSFMSILEGTNNWTLTNLALGGKGSYYLGTLAVATFNLKNHQNVIIGTGLNDLSNGSGTAQINKIVCGYNTIILNSWLRFASAASSVTSSGTWSNFTAITTKSASKLSGNARSASAAGATLTYTSPTADNVVIGCFGTGGTLRTYGRFNVNIDGDNKGDYTTDGKTDGLSVNSHVDSIINNAIVFEELANSTHTVVVTTLDNLVTPIDFFGTLNYSQNMSSVIALGTWLIPANTTGPPIASAAIESAVVTLSNGGSRPIAFVEPSRSYSLSNGVGVDMVHPNTLGYIEISREIQKSIMPSTAFENEALILKKSTIPFQLYQNSANNALTVLGNRDVNGGVDAAYTQVALDLYVGTSDAGLKVYGGTTPNTVFVQTMDVNGVGKLSVYSPSAQFNARSSLGTLGGVSIGSLDATHSYMGNQVGYNGTNFISYAAVAGLYRQAGSSHIFYGSIGNTIGGVYAQTPIASFNGTQQSLILGGITPATGLTNGINLILGTAQSADLTGGGVGMWSQLRNSVANTDGLALRVGTGGLATNHMFGPNVGIGTLNPTARLHLPAGTATAGTAAVKFTSGPDLTTGEDGSFNYNTSNNLTLFVSTTKYTIAKTLTNTAVLDFGSTLAGASTDLTITVTGAADGDPVSLGVPNASTVSTGTFSAWVSATNTVTVRYSNNSLSTLDPASGTFRVSTIKY